MRIISPNLSLVLLLTALAVAACARGAEPEEEERLVRPEIYATVPLTADLTALSEQERQMLIPLIHASRIMDELFWYQAYGDRDALLSRVENPEARAFVMASLRIAGQRRARVKVIGSRGVGGDP